MTLRGKEFADEGGALILEYTGVDLGSMVEAGVANDIPERADRAGLGFPGAKDKRRYSGKHKSARAHRARL